MTVIFNFRATKQKVYMHDIMQSNLSEYCHNIFNIQGVQHVYLDFMIFIRVRNFELPDKIK